MHTIRGSSTSLSIYRLKFLPEWPLNPSLLFPMSRCVPNHFWKQHQKAMSLNMSHSRSFRFCSRTSVVPPLSSSNARILGVSGASSFFKQCKDFGNPEALFRQGLKDFFDGLRTESGLELLSKATDKGHSGAKYVHGIILACHGGRHKEEGLKLLHFLTRSEFKSAYLVVRECRKEVKRAFTGMWLYNKLVENVERNC